MRIEEIKNLIKQELPVLINEDKELQNLILRLSRNEFADKIQTEGRFEKMLTELRNDREIFLRKWDEQKKEDKLKWDEQNKKWDEQKKEDKLKWDESRKEFDRVHDEIMAMTQKIDSGIGALGARWGIQSEVSFRKGLAGILEKSFKVEVMNITEFDDEGLVFGKPDQVELDIVIKNGELIIIEIKSSMNKGDMYLFERKIQYYEKKHGRIPSRKLVISPYIYEDAKKIGEKLGIELYSYSNDVKKL